MLQKSQLVCSAKEIRSLGHLALAGRRRLLSPQPFLCHAPARRTSSTPRNANPRVMGIDLGTTNSCVAIIENGKPKVLENPDTGSHTTPSVVSFDSAGGLLVGEAARRQSVLNPKNTVYGTKRLIGRRFDSEEVKEIKKHVPYDIVAASNNSGDAWVKAAGKSYSPSQIGAFVLGKMKEAVDKHLKSDITEAVITVPAYFNDSQRQATKDAGAIAGLKVLRILNEPTAASLAYGFNITESKESQTIAVFDLGGGTFDISILEIGEGMCQVLATNGDTFLGGEDFDEKVLQYLLAEFKRKEGVDLAKDAIAIQRIREGVEKAKKELDHKQSTEINLPFIKQEKHFQFTLSRSKFNELIAPLVDKTEEPCRNALKDADLEKVDNVILVGGMTRTPAVVDKVTQIFGKQPSKGVNPDEVVAMGAAIQGGVLAGQVSSLILLDVTPLSLGVNLKGDIFSRIIKRNSSIPCTNTQTYTTAEDGQRQVNFDLLQGEREVASMNHFLGNVSLPVLPAPKGVAKIEVTFHIDVNGIVHVTAKDPVTNKVSTVSVRASGGLSQNDIDKMLREAQAQKAFDEQVKAVAALRNQAETNIYTAENDYMPLDNVPAEDKQRLKAAVAALKAILQSEDKGSVASLVNRSEELKSKTEALKELVMEVGAKIYQQQSPRQSGNTNPDDQPHTHREERE
ncbi:Chaperone protein DnaK [Balamuthia mandrillaris]